MTDKPLRILMVCMGNICRSPIAEVVMRDRLDAAGLSKQVIVDSCGTGDWHEGEDADPRTRAVLVDHGYSLDHTARGFRPAWFQERDLILAMDHDNMRSLRRMARDAASSSEAAHGRSSEVAHGSSSGVAHGSSSEAAQGGLITPMHLLRSYDPELSHCSDEDPRLEVPDPYFGGADGFRDVLAMIERAIDGVMASYVLPQLAGPTPS